MCGIIYAKSFKSKPINQRIFQQFRSQRNRGIEGFGIYDKEYDNIIKNPDENGIIKYLNKHPSTEILFHHRWPTSTENVKNACHPFSTGKFFKNNYILVHNGSINNANEMHRKHEKLGIKYSSEQPDGDFNDSEALLWEFALMMEGQQKEVEARGGIAFICIKNASDGEDKLYWARNTNPLKVWRSNKGMMISSEGQGADAPSHELHTFDYKTKKVTSVDLTLPSYYWAPKKDDDSLNKVSGDDYNWNLHRGRDRSIHDGYYDDDGEFVPWDTKYLPSTTTVKKETPVLEIKPDVPELTFQEEVDLIYEEYLERAEGNFEDMWWLLSHDIDMLTDMAEDDPDVNDELRRLEFTLDKLAGESEFNDKNKIHSKWTKARFLSSLIVKKSIAKETANA